jgi:predicted XRE-type DNA-binding protein
LAGVALVEAARRVEARFWSKVGKDVSAACWSWTGSANKHGRGFFGVGGHTYLAPRIAWVLAHGVDPRPLSVLHRCDRPNCVNPSHLFLGTQQDNVDDMSAKGRRVVRRGESAPNAKLTADLVVEIRSLTEAGVRQSELARRFGVHRTTIRDAVNGRNWRSADGR